MSNEELRQEIRHAARRLMATTVGLMNDHEVVCAKLVEARSLAATYRSFLYGCDKHKLWQGGACIGCIEEENTRLRAALRRAVEALEKITMPAVCPFCSEEEPCSECYTLARLQGQVYKALTTSREALEEQPAKQ